MRNSDRFSKTLTAGDANNIVLLVDFTQILAPYQEFEADNIVEHTIAIEDLHAKVGLFSLQEAGWINANALASDAQLEAERAKILKEGQKIYLELFTARDNGPWERQGEEIFQNKNGLEQPWTLMLLLGTNLTALFGESLKIGIKIASKAQGVGGLKGTDYVTILGTWRKITEIRSKKKDDGVEALHARIAALEALFLGKIIEVPENSIIGRPLGFGPGAVQAIPNDFVNLSDLNNYVNLFDIQNIASEKFFLKPMLVGIDSSLAVRDFDNSNFRSVYGIQAINSFNGSVNFTANPGGPFAFLNGDFEVKSTSSFAVTPQTLGIHYRFRNYGSGLLNNMQGLRLTALNVGTGNINTLDGAAFTARNDAANTTVTTINGGIFAASVGNIAATATNINGGFFIVSAGAAAATSYVRGALISASSLNTVPALECIGLEIQNITGTALKKFSLKMGTGQAYFGDTTQSTASTNGSALFMGGIGIAGNLFSGGIVQATSFQVGGVKVIGAQETGWVQGTGTPNKGTFNTETATVIEIARRLFSVVQVLRNHGLINQN